VQAWGIGFRCSGRRTVPTPAPRAPVAILPLARPPPLPPPPPPLPLPPLPLRPWCWLVGPDVGIGLRSEVGRLAPRRMIPPSGPSPPERELKPSACVAIPVPVPVLVLVSALTPLGVVARVVAAIDDDALPPALPLPLLPVSSLTPLPRLPSLPTHSSPAPPAPTAPPTPSIELRRLAGALASRPKNPTLNPPPSLLTATLPSAPALVGGADAANKSRSRAVRALDDDAPPSPRAAASAAPAIACPASDEISMRLMPSKRGRGRCVLRRGGWIDGASSASSSPSSR
jgi:hypothetical protein